MPLAVPTGATCPSCGLALPADAPRGLCPACVFELDDLPPAGAEASFAPGPTKPSSFGDYELLGEIARGGMGVVYRARQRSLNRLVAVKVILGGAFADPQFIRRFQAEAAAAAGLQHPNIVAVHEVGRHDGQDFFSMDLVPGRSLAEIAREKPVPPRQAAAWLKAIAEAVHHAHGRGILHRDLKPSNVLIDETTGQPRITDFGLARRLDAESSLTMTGQVLGSPNFMPPEQAGSARGAAGRESDVYGLGGILYFLLTARPLFQADTLESLLQQVLNTDPVPPRLLNPGVPADLETICLKCLEKEPARRYPTAQAVADELGRFLADEPVLARPVSRAERLWRWGRRRPALAGTLASALVLLLVIAIGSPVAALRINRERRRAEAETATARHSLYIADMNLAQAALKDGHLGRARGLLRRHLPAAGATDLRGWEWFHLNWLSRGDDIELLGRHAGEVAAVAVSPDGVWAASGSADGSIKLWSLKARELVATLDGGGRVTALAFTPDNQTLVTLSQASGAKLWDTTSRQPVAQFPVAQSYFSGGLAISPDGKLVALARGDGVVELWSPQNRKKHSELALGATSVFALAFADGGQTLLVADDSGTIHLGDISTRREIGRLRSDGGYAGALAVSPDGHTLAYGGFDGAVRVWDFPSRQLRATLTNHTAAVMAVAFSPDGSVLASAGGDQSIRLWRTADWSAAGSLRGHEGVVRALAFAGNAPTLVSGSSDETVRLWPTVPAPAAVRRLEWPDRLSFAGILSSRHQAVSVHSDGHLRLWDLAGRSEPREFVLSLDCADLWGGSVYFNGSPLAVGNHQGVVVLWDAEREREVARFQAHQGRARCVSVSPDGTTVATSGEDGWLKLWDWRPTPRLRAEAEAKDTFWMSFSPDGRRLAATHENGSVSLWNVATLGVPVRLEGHKGAAVGAAFSANGLWLATSGWDGVAIVWELATGRRIATVTGPLLGINAVTFSPDSRRLAVGSQDGSIKLWDTRLWQEVADLKGHRGEVWEMAFLADDLTFVSAGRDALMVWPGDAEGRRLTNDPIPSLQPAGSPSPASPTLAR